MQYTLKRYTGIGTGQVKRCFITEASSHGLDLADYLLGFSICEFRNAA